MTTKMKTISERRSLIHFLQISVCVSKLPVPCYIWALNRTVKIKEQYPRFSLLTCCPKLKMIGSAV